MSKPKGTRDRATVEKMKKAPDKLEGQKALRAMLYQEVSKTEQEIIAGQFKLQELKKKITACNREIASLNKMIIENNSREKTEAEMEKNRTIVNQLVDNGVNAEEIIKQLGYNTDGLLF